MGKRNPLNLRLYPIRKGMKVQGLSFPCAFLLCLLCSSPDAFAASLKESESNDSIVISLNEIKVTVTKEKFNRLDNGSLRLEMSELKTSARVLGEADILLTLKTLPGIISNGDYGSGLIVDGAESSQSLFQIDGAPVFFPYRFGGIFSTFNSFHFRTANFERNFHDVTFPYRTGGKFDVSSYKTNQGLSGEVNVGLLSSSLGLRYGRGGKWCLSVSGRISYIDEIYGRILKAKDTGLGYSFSDLNVNGVYNLSHRDRISIGLFMSSDKLNAEGGNYELDTRISWNNQVVSIGWSHRGNSLHSPDINITAYYSGFNSKLRLIMPGIDVSSPAGISNLGIKADIRHQVGKDGRVSMSYGMEYNHYSSEPQWGKIVGIGSYEGMRPENQLFDSGRVFAGGVYSLSPKWELSGGLSLGMYSNSGYTPLLVDPKITVTRKEEYQTFAFHTGIYHQYLFQTGFSDIGLASNFWSGATSDNHFTTSYNFAGNWFRSFPSLFDIDLELYYKIVSNSPEFQGNILDLLGYDFNSLDHIRLTDGFNYGFNVTLSRRIQNLYLRLGYGYGDGKRRFGDENMWRSRTATGNTVKAVAEYSLGRHWMFNASFTYMSGRPYTPIQAVYLVAGNMLMDYGIQNSRRLPDYQRLDLSTSYIFASKKFNLRHIVNISLLNAYGHKNVEMIYYKISKDKFNVKLAKMSSLYRFLPSVSYTLEL